uniref:Uncharacterized protein MANES_09G029000 n=1 Tax=Rhizophora mucronata TaxID=61149 RepID=A0A2P2L2G6_RHIMU
MLHLSQHPSNKPINVTSVVAYNKGMFFTHQTEGLPICKHLNLNAGPPIYNPNEFEPKQLGE